MKFTFFEILQAAVTIIVLGVWAFLLVTGRTTPPEVYALVGAVVGFFFRSATVEAEKQAYARNLLEKENSLK